jgi:hypothetical protein
VAYNFIPCGREQSFLMPPSLTDWVGEDHLAWFVLDAFSQMDLSAFNAGVAGTKVKANAAVADASYWSEANVRDASPPGGRASHRDEDGLEAAEGHARGAAFAAAARCGVA